MRIAVIVPAFNESGNISGVIRDLRAHLPEAEIVAVNDCSTDNTEEIVRGLGEMVLSLPINLGIGGAVQTGLKYAYESGCGVAVQFDGDGQHQASEVHKLLEPLQADSADVVVGSRFLGTGSFRSSVQRRMGIFVIRWVNSLLIRKKITDNTSGFRAYNRRAMAFLSEYYPQDYPEPEAVIELFRNRFRIVEVPVSMVERQQGVSSIRMLTSVYYMVKVLLACVIAFSRRRIV